jgi:hypothetical protein
MFVSALMRRAEVLGRSWKAEKLRTLNGKEKDFRTSAIHDHPSTILRKPGGPDVEMWRGSAF